jgi:hypothetical protein
MCCRLHISPVDPAIVATVLEIGQFKYDPEADDIYGRWPWSRAFPGERTEVLAKLSDRFLEIRLSPAITTELNHQGHRHSGGCMFEIAARYAEKVNGLIQQISLIADCNAGRAVVDIAEYPHNPLIHEKICKGFRSLFLSSGS